MKRENKVVRVMTSGGLSRLGYAPAMRLKNAIWQENKNGWYVKQVIDDDTSNFFISLLRAIILIATIFIWCPASSFIVIFERQIQEGSTDKVNSSAMLCPICQADVEEGQKFCTKCGHKLD